MAVRYSYSVSAPIIIQKYASRKPVRVVVMSADNHISVSSSSSSIRSRTPFQMRLPSRNKVFEDLSNGIVCYREENGEITCEGMDEGPRFQFTSDQRETEMINPLDRSLVKMVDDDRFN